MVSTKLFVPAGAFAHESCGDTFPPLHPNVFNTWASVRTPFFTSVLESVKVIEFRDGGPVTAVFAAVCGASAVLERNRTVHRTPCREMFIEIIL
jgi:hypothetical protein